MITIYGLKNCDTCRKALKALQNTGASVILVDVREDSVPDNKLVAFLDAFGEALVNKRSTTWRNLSLADREAPPLEILRQNPAVMKRPVIEDDRLTLGWDKATQALWLGA